MGLFNRYRVIDYIRDYYEALHTTGRQYNVDDINIYRSTTAFYGLKKFDTAQKKLRRVLLYEKSD
ncbi:MAG TPA: DUF3791 domain-containing protein [Candidatus Choladousia intestinavium]|uniref:DUF3791 domain-containing protein n=1 Tax=Candidatus Choladousia intestinavium TaxID=2840727 RepID=A0A9D1AD31_9FIRM|nr:DUF3791 domain-containing protein [Candidatus Choladousia intestinavium]